MVTPATSQGEAGCPPVHPGEILLEEFLKPMGISQARLAADVGLSLRTINEIVHGRRSITAETALLLATYFGVTAESWVNLQAHHDLTRARLSMQQRIARVRPIAVAG
jgi:addiction module HigA family antidote